MNRGGAEVAKGARRKMGFGIDQGKRGGAWDRAPLLGKLRHVGAVHGGGAEDEEVVRHS